MAGCSTRSVPGRARKVQRDLSISAIYLLDHVLLSPIAVDSSGGQIRRSQECPATSATRGGRRCVEVSERSVPSEEVTTGLAEDDDLDLIPRVAAQDREAFEALYRRDAPDCAAT
jgi:hypothetical protein